MASRAIKTCLECGDRVSGRVDKKFCSDGCRINYNNRMNAPATRYVRNVTHALMRNRRTLQALNPTGKTRVTGEQLAAAGFDFRYFTSQYTTRNAAVYHFCFEQGYLKMDKNYYLLVIKKDI